MGATKLKLAIVTPVLDDWEVLTQLLQDLDRALAPLAASGFSVHLVAVDDGSAQTPDELPVPQGGVIESVELLRLNCNLGHQRAIAIGLSWLVANRTFDAVVVMDADGEDRPDDVRRLIEAHKLKPDHICVARRDQRSEGPLFQIGYRLYRLLFRLLTGQTLPFGNFCLIPRPVAERIIYHDNLWNHLAATILRSRFLVHLEPTARGHRYAGDAKMNPRALVLLGLSAVSVFSDFAVLRTLTASFALSVLTVIGILSTVVIRLFTDLAIPGWATTMVGWLVVVLIQCLVVSVFVLFIVLASRSQRSFIPARHFDDYVLDVRELVSPNP